MGDVSLWITLLSPTTNLSSSFDAQSSWKSHLYFLTSQSFLTHCHLASASWCSQGCAGSSHQCPSVSVFPTPTVWVDFSTHLTLCNSLTSFPDSKMYPFPINFCIETKVIFKDYNPIIEAHNVLKRMPLKWVFPFLPSLFSLFLPFFSFSILFPFKLTKWEELLI